MLSCINLAVKLAVKLAVLTTLELGFPYTCQAICSPSISWETGRCCNHLGCLDMTFALHPYGRLSCIRYCTSGKVKTVRIIKVRKHNFWERAKEFNLCSEKREWWGKYGSPLVCTAASGKSSDCSCFQLTLGRGRKNVFSLQWIGCLKWNEATKHFQFSTGKGWRYWGSSFWSAGRKS